MEQRYNSRILEEDFELLDKYFRTLILFKNFIPKQISRKERESSIKELFEQISWFGIQEKNQRIFFQLELKKFKKIFSLANSKVEEQIYLFKEIDNKSFRSRLKRLRNNFSRSV